MSRLLTTCTCLVLLLLVAARPAGAESVCDPDGLQASGSIYRICMPSEGYNGILVIWAHGFQNAGEPVAIPEDQLCANDFCIPDIVNGLGFGFATNSYRKTGLAILEGKEDIVDLVSIFAKAKGAPSKVYLVGASEGGIITALNVEQRPDIFSAGLAACGPVGDFPMQINYFGDARVTFEYFFPGVIPGDPFNPDPGLTAMWAEFFEQSVKPVVFHPDNRRKLDQWLAVANLAFDPANYLTSLELSVKDVLTYGVVNLNDASATLGGFPFENRARWYSGSENDLLLNIFITRVGAEPAAVAQMQLYNTTGVLTRPLVTLHTLRDQQIPYVHEQLYVLKTLFGGSFLSRHIHFPVDRFGHCNFNRDEVLFSFVVMLFYDNLIDLVTGTQAFLSPQELRAFEARARAARLPTRRSGSALSVRLKRR